MRSSFESSGPCTEVLRQSQLCFARLCQLRDERGREVGYSCAKREETWNNGATIAHVAGEERDCCNVCGASQVCKAYSWQVDTCFLKEEPGQNREWPNAVSGVLFMG